MRLGEFELDLHRTFVTGPFGLTIDLDELFASRTEINIGTRPLLALSAEHQFLHACYNVALGDYPVRLCSVRDLLLCLQHLDVDLDKIVAIAARWNGTAVVQRAAAVAIETVGAQVAAGFIELHALTVPRREQWLMGSYLTTARSYSRPLASLAVIPGLRPRLRYARAIVAPSAEYLKSRGWTASSHLQRALRRLRRHG
ncbi:nucleotidyltransferase family protein [bacterium]|nr:nucleotidyltransferase family protein [bacterium]